MRAPMLMGKEKTIPIFAMIILLIGIFSNVYVYANEISKDTINIQGQEYTIDQLFGLVSTKTIIIDDSEISGASLEELVLKMYPQCSSCSQFTIKAKDGYQQTVSWEVMKTGILTDKYRVIFADTAHSFWVRDVIKIEVK